MGGTREGFVERRLAPPGMASTLALAIATGAAICLAAPEVSAQASPWPSRNITLQIDSGVLRNTGDKEAILWSHVIELPDTSWMRLFFDTLELGFDPLNNRSAVLRIMSMEDGGLQHLNALTAPQWQNTTAYFNGNTVIIELIAPPHSGDLRVTLDHVAAGIPADPETICGPTDDRQLSDDPRAGRGADGCSHWLIDDNHHCLISAGHCSFTFTIIEFNVPLSNSSGQIIHPGPEDQYPVDSASIQFLNGGLGNDWGYYGLFPNSETGLTAMQAQGDFFTIAQPPLPSGQHIRITGYGTVAPPVPPEWNRAQKTHVGDYVALEGTRLRYTADTSGGNSGSPVILEETGQAIGVHTHGGCNSTGGSNSGTGLNLTSFQNALNAPRGICGPFGLEVDPITAGQETTMRATDVPVGQRVFFIYSTLGLGLTPVEALGVNLGIDRPVLAGWALGDNTRTATLTKTAPPNSSGVTVWIQAAHVGRTSEIVETTIK